MDQEALVSEQIDAGARFVAELAHSVPGKVACWVKPSDDERWRLCVASDQITDAKIHEGYHHVIRATRHLQDPWLSSFDVMLVGPDDSLVNAVLDVQQKYPGKFPMRYNARLLTGVNVEQIYIYAVPIAVPA